MGALSEKDWLKHKRNGSFYSINRQLQYRTGTPRETGHIAAKEYIRPVLLTRDAPVISRSYSAAIPQFTSYWWHILRGMLGRHLDRSDRLRS